MLETDIRNPKSDGNVKQKICNYIKTDDGTEILEFKDGKVKKSILVSDFLYELKKAHNKVQR